MKETVKKITVFAGLVGLCTAASCQSLLSTLGSTAGNEWLVGAGQFTVAEQFTTGSAATTVGSVIFDPATSLNTASAFNLGIYSNASGTPGSLLSNGSLTAPASITANSLTTYTASGLTLGANSTYWLVFSDSVNTVEIYDRQGSSLVTTSSAGWTLGQLAISLSGGPYNDNYTGVAEPLFSINAPQPVPEPGALPLAGVGLGMSLLFFFRKQ